MEPVGLSCPEEVEAQRRHHLGRIRQLVSATDIFVFTFGLTKAWRDRPSGTVFPTAPGTIAGAYDPDAFEFVNLTFADTLADFLAFRALVKRRRPEARFLVTVSPVPLTATASGDHMRHSGWPDFMPPSVTSASASAPSRWPSPGRLHWWPLAAGILDRQPAAPTARLTIKKMALQSDGHGVRRVRVMV